jgi:hypothetical protein
VNIDIVRSAQRHWICYRRIECVQVVQDKDMNMSGGRMRKGK